jgi:hypothetical protein
MPPTLGPAPHEHCASLERRRGPRRRQHCPVFADWRFLLRNRRRVLRRASDQRGVYLDWHPASLWIVALGILLLSALDAALTLILVQYGANEANPLLRPFLERDLHDFINLKLLLTAVPLVLLVAHSRLVIYGYIRVQTIVHGLLLVYFAVIVYELFLLNSFTTQ